MIRRDYLLRMIEEFRRVLEAVLDSKRNARWREASESLDQAFQRLIGTRIEEASRLSDIELRARLVHGAFNHFVPEKARLLAALFKEAGDLAEAENRPAECRIRRLKALELLLESEESAEAESIPDFVPRLEMLAQLLSDTPLPPRLAAAMMFHYERIGAFAKAEDALHDLIDSDPSNLNLIDFGISYYQRLQSLNDATLVRGDLPKSEVETGLEECLRRRSLLTREA